MHSVYQFREIKNENDYHPLALNPNTHFAQSWQYGEWQKSIGREVRRFVVRKNENATASFQLIKFILPLNRSILYIPHGPILKELPDKDFFNEFGAFCKQLLREERAMFLRLDLFPPHIAEHTILPPFIQRAPTHIYHSAYFQPKNEWFISLTKPENDIISSMHPKARYNAHLAERKGVTIEISYDLETYFHAFWPLLEITAERDHFHLQPKTYYETIFHSCAAKKNAFLVIARHNETILVMNFVFLFGNIATFVYGGSSNEERNLMPSYLVQQETIKETKRLGSTYYNLGGVTDGSKEYQSWEGFTIFKKKFGGELMTYGTSYDIIREKIWYQLYDLRRRIKTLWR